MAFFEVSLEIHAPNLFWEDKTHAIKRHTPFFATSMA